MHVPFMHRWPDVQAAPAPQVQAPFLQVSLVFALHAVLVAPAAPHAIAVGGFTHAPF